MKATLRIVQTSDTCVRYEIILHGKRIWSNRVVPTEAGHAGARARMAAWIERHGVVVQEQRRAA